jgi:DnaJ-class molecular chaperone
MVGLESSMENASDAQKKCPHCKGTGKINGKPCSECNRYNYPKEGSSKYRSFGLHKSKEAKLSR